MRYSAWSEDVDAVLKYYKVHEEKVRNDPWKESAELQCGCWEFRWRHTEREKGQIHE